MAAHSGPVRNHQDQACASLFAYFTFAPIQHAQPPKSKGVYVIRVVFRGQPVVDVRSAAENAVISLHWPMVEKKVCSRLSRMNRIAHCPIIYIGSAGTGDTSKHTLHGRYKDLSGRHTAMFPVWALLYHHWKLDYGWLEASATREMEAELKKGYLALHGSLPALVQR